VEHLFVYGTLRRGSQNKFAQLLAERAQLVAAARVQGLLYDFGSYPGAVPSNQASNWIVGEIHSFEDSQLLSLLDEYEGSEYERAITPAHTGSGRIDCSIYWYVGTVGGRPITSGDWLRR
jgi:gamma-glutamylcyclotransferase (GGCT)/AIG2-like uncharacterized protein YtfP